MNGVMQKATIPQKKNNDILVKRNREFHFTYSAKYNHTNIDV